MKDSEWTAYLPRNTPTKALAAAIIWEYSRQEEELLRAAKQAARNPPTAMRLLLATGKIKGVLRRPTVRLIWESKLFPKTSWMDLPEAFKNQLIAAFDPASTSIARVVSVSDAVATGYPEWLHRRLEQDVDTGSGESVAAMEVSRSASNPTAGAASYITICVPHGTNLSTRLRDVHGMPALEGAKDMASREPRRNILEKVGRKLLKGLALLRLQRETGATWREIHTFIKENTGHTIYNQQKSGSDMLFPAHTESRDSAEAFQRNFLKWLSEGGPMQLATRSVP